MHAYYLVKIEVFADPSMPPLTTEELKKQDFDQGFKDLMKELNEYTTDELQDLVHRRFEYRLCRACHSRFIANPLGLPRAAQVGKN
jgi:hypothetical protein